MNTTAISSNGLTAAQQALSDIWDEHVRDEFATKDAAGALNTMVQDAYVNHVPVLTGGVGREQLQEFYSKHFIPNMPADTEIVPISRTIGSERLVDEMIIRFTHDIEIDWWLPGIAPTGKRVECATVAVITFRDGKLYSEHIYWDQASVLVQLGLLDPSKLPVAGVETAKKLIDPSLPSNQVRSRTGLEDSWSPEGWRPAATNRVHLCFSHAGPGHPFESGSEVRRHNLSREEIAVSMPHFPLPPLRTMSNAMEVK